MVQTRSTTVSNQAQKLAAAAALPAFDMPTLVKENSTGASGSPQASGPSSRKRGQTNTVSPASNEVTVQPQAKLTRTSSSSSSRLQPKPKYLI